VSAREEVLGRIRAANAAAGSPAPVAVPRDYHRTGRLAPGSRELRELLIDRLVDYKATVIEAAADGVPDAVARGLADAGVTVTDPVATRPPHAARVAAAPRRITQRVLVPPGLPDGWCPDGVPDEPGFGPTDLDGFAAVVTASAAACAQTGTIALDGSPDQGRRAITLIPDVHVCVVRADQVVETVPELLARLDPTRPTTFVSGPSATSDIELERVEGVHGPRTLIVVLCASGAREWQVES
jgi:L-lactate dehydrogenase complex protein LldG